MLGKYFGYLWLYCQVVSARQLFIDSCSCMLHKLHISIHSCECICKNMLLLLLLLLLHLLLLATRIERDEMR